MRRLPFSLMLVLVVIGAAWTTNSKNATSEVRAQGKARVVRDKSKPVRIALEAQYAKLAQAIRNKNYEGYQAIRTSDFSTRGADGKLHDFKILAAQARAMLERIQAPIDVSVTIDSIDVRGKEAVATIHQRFSRKQSVSGQLRKVETRITQDETWVQTPAGWKLKLIEKERDLMWFVDGKRVEPGKQYDPNAPAYNPGAAAQTATQESPSGRL